MKKNFRGLTLAAAMLCASASAQADNGDFAGSDSRSFVGDMSSASADTHAGEFAAAPIPNYAPVTVGDLQPTVFSQHAGAHHAGVNQTSHLSMGGCSGGSCDGGCDGGCDAYGCDSKGCDSRLGSMLNLCEKDGWIRAEGLVMFMQERHAPALVSSADPTVFPVLSDPNTQVEFGEELDGGVSGGFRGDIGRYLSDGFGVGGRVLWLSENGDEYAAGGSGQPGERSIGRPYFFIPTINPSIAGEDAEIVNQANLFAGNVESYFETHLVGAEAYGRLRFCANKQSRLELIGGYSFYAIDDELGIRSVSTNLDTAASTTFGSLFDAENRFHGGQIGFESVIRRGCWSARMLSKVHLGNMQQTVNISGFTQDQVAGQPAQPRTNSSLLVDERQGEETDDVFTFIPELNMTLGYRFRDHVSFTVGYTFLYFDSVALAGNQINRFQDTDDLGAPVVPVGFDIVDDSLWVQGISIGASVDY